MKLLLLDIETSPNTAYVWGLWDKFIPLARLIETGGILCWSARWLDSKTTMFNSIYKSSHKTMLKEIHKLLEQSDAVIHYNGSNFDIPVLNKEFLLAGMTPPAPYKQIDLYKVAKSQFRFVSNKLDHVAEQLGHGKKHETSFKLWIDCMNNDPKAWKQMERYNKHDVKLLELVYQDFKPWIKGHPNYGLYVSSDRPVCPTCGSSHLHSRGVARTLTNVYSRFQCSACGTWTRSTKIETDKRTKQLLMRTN